MKLYHLLTVALGSSLLAGSLLTSPALAQVPEFYSDDVRGPAPPRYGERADQFYDDEPFENDYYDDRYDDREAPPMRNRAPLGRTPDDYYRRDRGGPFDFYDEYYDRPGRIRDGFLADYYDDGRAFPERTSAAEQYQTNDYYEDYFGDAFYEDGYNDNYHYRGSIYSSGDDIDTGNYPVPRRVLAD